MFSGESGQHDDFNHNNRSPEDGEHPDEDVRSDGGERGRYRHPEMGRYIYSNRYNNNNKKKKLFLQFHFSGSSSGPRNMLLLHKALLPEAASKRRQKGHERGRLEVRPTAGLVLQREGTNDRTPKLGN